MEEIKESKRETLTGLLPYKPKCWSLRTEQKRSVVLAESFDFLSNYQLFKGTNTGIYIWGRKAGHTSVVNRSAAVCLPVDSVTVIGPLCAKSADISLLLLEQKLTVYICVSDVIP